MWKSYLFIYCNFCVCASMILGMVLQTAEHSLIQKAPSPRNSGQTGIMNLVLCWLGNMLGYKWLLS